MDGWVRRPLRSSVHVMSPLPITAVSQIRPNVDDSAIVVHWNKLSTEDSTTPDDVVSLVVVLLATANPASPPDCCCCCSVVPIDKLNAI